jgi:hypothetical protein
MWEMKRLMLPIAVFFAFFLVVFALISFTQSAYSVPKTVAIAINDKNNFPLPLYVGPKPNSTDVPLNTAIEFYQPRPIQLETPSLTPNGRILSRSDQLEGVASRITLFFPDIPLKPSTSYNVSLTIAGTYFAWSFTTSATFHPDIHYFLKTYCLWIALLAGVLSGILSYLVVKRKRLAFGKIVETLF